MLMGLFNTGLCESCCEPELPTTNCASYLCQGGLPVVLSVSWPEVQCDSPDPFDMETEIFPAGGALVWDAEVSSETGELWTPADDCIWTFYQQPFTPLELLPAYPLFKAEIVLLYIQPSFGGWAVYVNVTFSSRNKYYGPYFRDNRQVRWATASNPWTLQDGVRKCCNPQSFTIPYIYPADPSLSGPLTVACPT